MGWFSNDNTHRTRSTSVLQANMIRWTLDQISVGPLSVDGHGGDFDLPNVEAVIHEVNDILNRNTIPYGGYGSLQALCENAYERNKVLIEKKTVAEWKEHFAKIEDEKEQAIAAAVVSEGQYHHYVKHDWL